MQLEKLHDKGFPKQQFCVQLLFKSSEPKLKLYSTIFYTYHMLCNILSRRNFSMYLFTVLKDIF